MMGLFLALKQLKRSKSQILYSEALVPVCSLLKGPVIFKDNILYCNKEPLLFDSELSNISVNVVGHSSETNNTLSLYLEENTTFTLILFNISINSKDSPPLLVDKGNLIIHFFGENTILTPQTQNCSWLEASSQKIYAIYCTNGAHVQIRVDPNPKCLSTFLIIHQGPLQSDKISIIQDLEFTAYENHYITHKVHYKQLSQSTHDSKPKLIKSSDLGECSLGNKTSAYLNIPNNSLKCNGRIETFANFPEYTITIKDPTLSEHVEIINKDGCIVNLIITNNVHISHSFDPAILILGGGITNIKFQNNVSFAQSANPAIQCDGDSVVILNSFDPFSTTNKLTLSSGSGYPGIGPADKHYHSVDRDFCKKIQIDGGIYEITPGDNAAGIGGNKGFKNDKGYVSEIEINGGNLTFNLKEKAAGIGGGAGDFFGSSYVGSIRIAGSSSTLVFNPILNSKGAFIGGGAGISENSSFVNLIEIYNGTFEFKSPSRFGAVIGAGSGDFAGSSFVKIIKIHEGQFQFKKDDSMIESDGSLIGGGIGNGIGSSYVEIIEISGGLFKMNHTKYGASIGGGCGLFPNSSFVNKINISGGIFVTVYQRTDNQGAIIGSGAGKNSFSSNINEIYISNGLFELKQGSNASIIGGGLGKGMNSSSVNLISISGGRFKLTMGNYGAGIGAGYGLFSGSSLVKTIEISNGNFTIYQGEKGAIIGGGYGFSTSSSFVDLILISGGNFTFSINSVFTTFFGAMIGGGYGLGTSSSNIRNITILGGTFNFTVPNEIEYKGALIGSGSGNGLQSSIINFLGIKGGSFELKPGKDGAAIGTGSGENIGSSCVEEMTINEGIFLIETFHFSDDNKYFRTSALIGTGKGNFSQSSNIGTIKINGGSFTMNDRWSSQSALIGGGRGHSSNSSNIEAIEINGGKFELNNYYKKYSSIIGAGNGVNQNSSNVGTIKITNGLISIFQEHWILYGALIGAGCGLNNMDKSQSALVGLINISGGEIKTKIQYYTNKDVYDSSTGAGIGGGFGSSQFQSNVDTIIIGSSDKRLNLNITGGQRAAGIGAGLGNQQNSGSVALLEIKEFSNLDDILISTSHINPIGGTDSGQVTSLKIPNSTACCRKNTTKIIKVDGNDFEIKTTTIKKACLATYSFSQIENEDHFDLKALACLMAMQNFEMYD